MFTTEPSESFKAMLNAAMLAETIPVIGLEPDPWEFTTDVTGALPVVTAEGFLDMSNKDDMREEVLSAAAYGAVVVVDMSHTFCDAAGLRVLDEIAQLLADDGGELRLVTVRRLTVRFLDSFRLNRRMRVFSTLTEALSGSWQDRTCQPELLAA